MNPVQSFAYVPPDVLFQIPVDTEDDTPPIPDLSAFPVSSSSSASGDVLIPTLDGMQSSSSSSHSSSSSSSSSSSRSSSSRSSSSRSSSVNSSGIHTAATTIYLDTQTPLPPPTSYPVAVNAPIYDPVTGAAILSIRPEPVRGDLSNTGPSEIIVMMLLVASGAYTIRRAYKLDKVPV